MKASIPRRRPRRWSAGRLLLCAVAVIAIALAAFFPFAGRLLVVEDPLQKADVIVVLAGARADRWLEAADLYREGAAPRVVVSPGRFDRAEDLARSRGVRLPAEGDIVRDALVQLRVPPDAISVMPEYVDNTAQEAAASHRLAERYGWTRLIVATSKYHSRRVQFAFRREFRGTGATIIVRPSRYDSSTPARWWRSRADIRFVVDEYEKVVFYRLGLGT